MQENLSKCEVVLTNKLGFYFQCCFYHHVLDVEFDVLVHTKLQERPNYKYRIVDFSKS